MTGSRPKFAGRGERSRQMRKVLIQAALVALMERGRRGRRPRARLNGVDRKPPLRRGGAASPAPIIKEATAVHGCEGANSPRAQRHRAARYSVSMFPTKSAESSARYQAVVVATSLIRISFASATPSGLLSEKLSQIPGIHDVNAAKANLVVAHEDAPEFAASQRCGSRLQAADRQCVG
jgi:hypothetical protein